MKMTKCDWTTKHCDGTGTRITTKWNHQISLKADLFGKAGCKNLEDSNFEIQQATLLFFEEDHQDGKSDQWIKKCIHIYYADIFYERKDLRLSKF